MPLLVLRCSRTYTSTTPVKREVLGCMKDSRIHPDNVDHHRRLAIARCESPRSASANLYRFPASFYYGLGQHKLYRIQAGCSDWPTRIQMRLASNVVGYCDQSLILWKPRQLRARLLRRRSHIARRILQFRHGPASYTAANDAEPTTLSRPAPPVVSGAVFGVAYPFDLDCVVRKKFLDLFRRAPSGYRRLLQSCHSEEPYRFRHLYVRPGLRPYVPLREDIAD